MSTRIEQNIVMFQVTYAWSLPFIKTSICLTMLRIITEKPLRVIIWIAMVASIVTASEYIDSTPWLFDFWTIYHTVTRTPANPGARQLYF